MKMFIVFMCLLSLLKPVQKTNQLFFVYICIKKKEKKSLRFDIIEELLFRALICILCNFKIPT